MRIITVCGKCDSHNIDYLGHDKCYCHDCKKETDTRDLIVESYWEKRANAVYATGNRWAIENWNAVH